MKSDQNLGLLQLYALLIVLALVQGCAFRLGGTAINYPPTGLGLLCVR